MKTPFTTVLVANRGEIALRVMRSARALGHRTVAVYSSADADSRHVREADLAVCIGGATPRESYLNIPALIEAAQRTGADAVHPGYGFLAENPDFARACREAGLVFIGPSPEAMAAMGHKAGAKRRMAAAGVPCIPGYDGEDQSAERLQTEAERVGYPLMIKACAGGGGRGMRLVESADGFAAALASAQSEALNAFGDASVLLERAVLRPRHIEIQVLADRYGHAIHLGERDCSVQRRHQKIIEEAPSPAVSPELRERMGAVAVRAVQALGYEGVGTLEFLLEETHEGSHTVAAGPPQGDGAPSGGSDPAQRRSVGANFYFLEMNTRLQVEHPVTEAITGLDLVALQLQVAAGEPLPLSQADVRFQGHAIEVRLCAEDPTQGFVPQSGRVLRWRADDRLRTESALQDGCEIPPWYDSMVAKLIAHGPDRESARRRLIAGLQDTVALGLPTNQTYLAACLRHPVWAAGGATTAFIGEHGETLLSDSVGKTERQAAVGALALLECDSDQHHPLAARHPVRLRYRCGSGLLEATATREGDGWRLRMHTADGETDHTVAVLAREPGRWRLTLDGVQRSVDWARSDSDPRTVWLQSLGDTWCVRDERLKAAQRANDNGDGQVRAAMNGRVVALHVALGQAVQRGDTVLTLEAMKMEHRHSANTSGVVRAVHVQPGDQVSAARVLVEITPEATP